MLQISSKCSVLRLHGPNPSYTQYIGIYCIRWFEPVDSSSAPSAGYVSIGPGLQLYMKSLILEQEHAAH